MKTPIQELIEALKIHRDTALQKEKQYEDLVLTEYYEGRAKAFEDAISFAEAHLKKEEEVMCKFAYEFETRNNLRSAEQVYNETFNTQEE